jgi:hypothetical protein
MKLKGAIITIGILALLLVACDGDNHGSDYATIDVVRITATGSVDNTVIENYIYVTEKIDMQYLAYQIQGAMLQDNRIYYRYADSESNIVVISMTVDGGNRQSTQLPVSEGLISIGSVRFSDNGNIEVFYSVSRGFGDSSLIHRVYTSQGVELSNAYLSDILPPDIQMFNIGDMLFTEMGYSALTVTAGNIGFEVLLFDSSKELIGHLSLGFGENILKLSDGRIVVWNSERENSNLREIRFDTGDFGETFTLSVQSFQNLACAGDSDEYDLLLFDGTNIIGYEINSATATPLFNWFEVNLGVAGDFHIGFLQDERMFVIYSRADATGWNTELFLLTRTDRDELTDQPTIITVGGIWVSQNVRGLVTLFNRNNHEYQIEIRCYDTLYGWEAGLTRFNLDMIAGQGPDVIVGQSVETLENTEFLTCLYSFIDADYELDRNVFLPSILRGLESNDGRLQLISNNFDIFLFSALSETVEQVGELTFENIIRWLSEADSRHLGPEWFNREWLVRESLLSFSDEFINWDDGVANLNNPEFINLLNVAATLPEPEQFGFRSEIDDLRDGNQLFDFDILTDVNGLRGGRRVAFGEIWASEMIPVGVPSNNPGQHEFVTDIGTLVGINAGSVHPETAWNFVKLFLMPDGIVSGRGIPLRIDLFEGLIDEAMTPHVVNGEEVARADILGNRFYAMTEEDAAAFLEVVNNTTIRQRRNETLENIINESLQPFFAGGATAEDTARVMQSRISIFLAERS